MVAGEIMAGLSAFKTMFDLAKGVKDANDSATRNAVAIELQEKILSAQAQQAELIEHVRNLEEEVAHFKTWEDEKQRYKLEALPPGVHVYALKEGMENGEPPHKICQTCYQRGKKSILHQSATHNGLYHLKCNECEADLKVGHYVAPTPVKGPTWGPRGGRI